MLIIIVVIIIIIMLILLNYRTDKGAYMHVKVYFK